MGLREYKKEMTIKEILKQSEILFTTQSFDKTRISQIAKASKIAEGTIYNYFSSKFAILISIIENKASNDEVVFSSFDDSIAPSKIIKKVLNFTNSFWGWVSNVEREFARTIFSSVIAGKELKLLTNSAIKLNRDYVYQLGELLELVSSDEPSVVRQQTIVIFSIVITAIQLYVMDLRTTKEDIWLDITGMIILVMTSFGY